MEPWEVEFLFPIEAVGINSNQIVITEDVICNPHGSHKENIYRIYRKGNEKGVKMSHKTQKKAIKEEMKDKNAIRQAENKQQNGRSRSFLISNYVKY